MLLIIRKPATPEQIASMAEDYDGFISEDTRGKFDDLVRKLFLATA